MSFVCVSSGPARSVQVEQNVVADLVSYLYQKTYYITQLGNQGARLEPNDLNVRQY